MLLGGAGRAGRIAIEVNSCLSGSAATGDRLQAAPPRPASPAKLRLSRLTEAEYEPVKMEKKEGRVPVLDQSLNRINCDPAHFSS